MCEGCGAKKASFGTPSERKRRWCSGCSKAHGAINLNVKMCEGCGAKEANFGTPTEREKRWCSGCGKVHGAVSVDRKPCVGCKTKPSSKRWRGHKITTGECWRCWLARTGDEAGWVQFRASSPLPPPPPPLPHTPMTRVVSPFSPSCVCVCLLCVCDCVCGSDGGDVVVDGEIGRAHV